MSEINKINVNGTSYDIADNSAQELLSDLIIVKDYADTIQISANSYTIYRIYFDYDDSEISDYIAFGVSGYSTSIGPSSAQSSSVFVRDMYFNYNEGEESNSNFTAYVINSSDSDVTSFGLHVYIMFIKKECYKFISMYS